MLGKPPRLARWVACALLLALPLRGASQQGEGLGRLTQELPGLPFTITADEVAYEQERDVYEARGHVRIEQPGGRSLSADWVTFSAKTRIGVATGNVRLQDGADTMTAEFAAVDLDTLVALATDAQLDTPKTGFLVRGELLRKTGPDSYHVEGGTFTTCRCPPGEEPLPWEIECGRADIRVEGYAVARDVKLRAFGLPVFYTPWLVLPVKTERQSGFLFPTISNSGRSGLELELPFFWAVRDDTNLLLRPAWSSDRGFKPGLEFEHVFGEQGFSNGGGSILAGDDKVQRDDPDTRFSDDRWAYWLRHEQPLGEGLRLGADVAQVSDNDYVVDFDDLDETARTERFLESSAWGSGARQGLYGGVRLATYDDLQSPNDLDRDDFQLQRMPEAALAALPRRVGSLPLLASGDVRYTFFKSFHDAKQLGGISPVGQQFFDTGPDGLFNFKEPNAQGAFDGLDNDADDFPLGFEGDGRFQEGELLADHGHRADFFPRLALPLQVGIVELLSEVGYRETLYQAWRADGDSRGLATARVDARTRLERPFAFGALDLLHVVEPRAGFAFVSDQAQDRNPLFVPRGALRPDRQIDGDLRLISRDPADRIEDARFLEVGFGNRLFSRDRAHGEPPRQIASLRLGSGYDFELSRISNVYLEGEFQPTRFLELNAQLGYDGKHDEVDEALVHLAWTGEDRTEFALDYRYLRELPLVFEAFRFSDDVFDEFDEGFDRINQLSLEASYDLADRLLLFGDGYLSFEDSSAKSGRIGIVYTSSCKCWDLTAAVRRRSRGDDTSFQLAVQFAGLGRFGRGGR